MSKFYIAKQAVGQYNTGDKIPTITDDELKAAVKDGKTVNGLTAERAKFLLSKGAIAEPEGEDADTAEDDTNEVVELDTLTNKELKALLDEEGIEYNASDDKKTLIALFPKD
ncbi:hypothetical protein [Psychrobacter piscatorii]|uniref:T4 recombination endonuclease VII dimerisation domain-containing protein n=1 Tax=Psychrobacter piscatorii TaxID=554343 RepID=A0A0T6DTS4_9GAMM|nr:hypothetical protein [Psychrobacter piscatorii]KRU23295.1 hypothetical protein AS194_05035 [Psychrobacter piscatorii]